MDDEILTIYCLCDDFLLSASHHDHPSCQMSSAEVMTVALVAVLYFGGNFAHARRLLHEPKWMPVMLSKSRFSRRLYRVEHQFLVLFHLLAEAWKAKNKAMIFARLKKQSKKLLGFFQMSDLLLSRVIVTANAFV